MLLVDAGCVMIVFLLGEVKVMWLPELLWHLQPGERICLGWYIFWVLLLVKGSRLATACLLESTFSNMLDTLWFLLGFEVFLILISTSGASLIAVLES